MDLSRYWFKYAGNSWRIFRLPGRDELTQAERLLASILAGDVDCDFRLKTCSSEDIQRFVELVIEQELCGYVYESLFLLKLVEIARETPVKYHDAVSDLFAVLTRQSSVEAIKFEAFDDRFIQFLEAMSKYGVPLVWFKGIVTSRTCYPSPSTRLSSDFDFFIQPQHLEYLNDALTDIGFVAIANDTGFCNQLGVGPTASVSALLLVPTPEFVASGVIGYSKAGWPIIDVKINPIDRGICMLELERFLQNLVSISWKNQVFAAPDLFDQLLISLTHLEKDRFLGWKHLLDVVLLVQKIQSMELDFDEFIRRARVEGVSTACAAGLSLAKERLNLQGIDDVIDKLSPADCGLLRRLFTFTITPLFYWNTSGLPMLVANQLLADDCDRKRDVLLKSLVPERSFLSKYYWQSRPLNPFTVLVAYTMHCLVLLLPGGVVRRTIGPLIWKKS